VLFHLLPAACPGGFAGVDVFFVLSGFLVTGRALEDLGAGRFSVAEFYHRRIRRILPAYTALILAVFATGCLLFHAVPLVRLADAMVMSTWFAANVYFEKTATGYFAQEDRASPLLHLWSLGVEEQFYLLLPVVALLAGRRGLRLLAPVLGLLWIGSFAAAALAVAGGQASRAFYLGPYRAWELLTGSLLALAARSTGGVGPGRPTTTASVAAVAGLVLLLLPYAWLDSATPFPGIAAAASVLGTALLVRFGGSGPVGRLLSAPPPVAVGKASYSIYLWHWPVFVFWRHATFDEVGPAGLLAMLLLSMALAVLSWRWIEEPPRRSAAWGRARSFRFAALSMSVLTLLGVACAFGRGWPEHLHPSANRLVNEDFQGQFVESFLRHSAVRAGRWLGFEVDAWPRLPEWLPVDGLRHVGAPGREDLLVVGDSHAACLVYGLGRELGARGLGVDTIVFHSRLVFAEPATLERIAASKARTILLAQFWTSPRHDRETMFRDLRRFALAVAATGRRLFIATDVPVWPVPLAEIHARMEIVRPPRMRPEWSGLQGEEEFLLRQGEVNRRIAEIARETGAGVVPLHEAFRRQGVFRAFDDTRNPPVVLFNDRSHLSSEGSLRAATFLVSALGLGEAKESSGGG
jgi:peptidoglycan/LPS O-acetylase OafA/YrhL